MSAEPPKAHRQQRMLPAIWSRYRRGRIIAIMGLGVIIGLTGIVISASLITISPAPFASQTTSTPLARSRRPSPTATPFSTFQENQRPGSRAWELTKGSQREFLQAYLGTVSTTPDHAVALYVSSQMPTDFTLAIFRLGWYGGAGGRLMASLSGMHSLAQGTWSPHTGLINCATCQIDPVTHRVEANWSHPISVTIAADWPGGIYWLKLSTPRNQAETAVVLVVRAAAERAPVLANLPVNTYQAYNVWGGYSLYGAANHRGIAQTIARRATQVSFDRPLLMDRLAGSGDFLSWDLPAIHWLERAGIAVDYTTDVDIDAHPQRLTQHRIVLVLGHSEYWTKAMYDAALAARDAGVSLGFWGSNAIYWQARLEPDSSGKASRTLTCYKVESGHAEPTMRLSADPMSVSHPEWLTAQWRDPALHRPENGLIGIMYRSYFAAGHHPDWVAASGTSASLLAAAGITPGAHVRGGLVGYEFDSVYANGASPNGLTLLGESPVRSIYGRDEQAATTYYRAASGAVVFAAGTLHWSWGLDERSFEGANDPNLLHGSAAISRLTAALLHMMDPTLVFSTPQLAG